MNKAEIDAFLDGPDDHFGSFLDAPMETPVAPAHPANALGRALYEAMAHAVKSASPFQAGPVLDTATAAAVPGAEGLLRLPEHPGTPTGDQIARVIGQGLPVLAGTAAAGAALPVVAPAALAASPLLAPAAAAGLGAAAGNTAQQLGAKVAGGDAPESIGAALNESGKVGLFAAATDLGLGAVIKGIAAIAPKTVSMFKTFPKEGMKRTLQRPDEVLDIIASSKEPQVAAENAGVKALREIQNGLTIARNEAGKAVEKELAAFHSATGGRGIIDPGVIADAGSEAMTSRATSEGVSALTNAEARRVSDVIKEISEQPPLSARDAVVWRRKLDNLINFKRGAVADISSGEGQAIISHMARALRGQIQQAAEEAGAYNLAEANANFSRAATAYDSYRPVFNTKTTLGSEAARRLDAVESIFNKGGISQQDLTQIGQQIPVLQKPVDRLLDAVVARRLSMESTGSPSDVTMSAIRFLAGPDGLATAMQAGRSAGKLGIRRVAAPAVATAASLEMQK